MQLYNREKKVIIFVLLLFVSFSPPSAETILAVEDFSFDKDSGDITYKLTRPAKVRIRIGINHGPLYRNIGNWEEKSAGRHKKQWDGKDTSGTFNLLGRDDLMATINYFSPTKEEFNDFRMLGFNYASNNVAGRSLPVLEIDRIHKQHPQEYCKDLALNLRFLGRIPKTKDGFYIIRKKTPLEITLPEEDRLWFTREFYSVFIFIDDVLVQGELEGYTPYTWIFNPKGINEGRHLIVVNLQSSNDHYAIGSIPVYVKK